MALCFQNRMKQVNVFFWEHLGCRGFWSFPRKDGDVGEVDGGDGIKGQAFTQVVDATVDTVQFSVFYLGPGLPGSELGFNGPSQTVSVRHGRGVNGVDLSLCWVFGRQRQPV